MRLVLFPFNQPYNSPYNNQASDKRAYDPQEFGRQKSFEYRLPQAAFFGLDSNTQACIVIGMRKIKYFLTFGGKREGGDDSIQRSIGYPIK